MVDRTRHHEEQIGEPVDIPNQDQVDRRLQRHHAPLRAAADRPRKVQPGAGLDAARKNKMRERRKIGLEPIDELLEALDIGVMKRRLRDAGGNLVGGIGEPGAKRKQIALDLHERVADVGEPGAVSAAPSEARAKPSQALSSSTSPYASTRASLFETRVPPKSDVSPVSPVRV